MVVRYTELQNNVNLSRDHQYNTIYTFKRYCDRRNWSGSIYFCLSNTPYAGYADEDHPFAISVKLLKPIRCIECESYFESCFDSVPEDLYSQTFDILKKELGSNLKKKEDTPYLRWLADNGFAFIDRLWSNQEGREVAIPYDWISSDVMFQESVRRNQQMY